MEQRGGTSHRHIIAARPVVDGQCHLMNIKFISHYLDKGMSKCSTDLRGEIDDQTTRTTGAENNIAIPDNVFCINFHRVNRHKN
ncbi:hypothetical protein D3C85_1619660 [compost metagenome]